MPLRSEEKPVIWAFSSSRLREVLESAAPVYADRAEVRVFERSFEDALQTALTLTRADERVDAIVAAGSNGVYLRDHAQVPVALVDVSTTDALQALAHARTLGPRIGIVNFRRVLPGLERWKDLLSGVQIEQRAYVTPEEARAAVAELAARGYEVIVGPGPACDVAERDGLKSVLLYSFECVCETFERAIEMAQVARAERRRREQLASVIDHIDEAVVAVDASERIAIVNPGFERLLGVAGAELIGKRLSSITPELSLSRVLETGAPELRSFQKLGARSLVVSRIPVRERGVLAGAVLTCQDSRTLLRVDRDLRSELRPRRFIARYELSGIVGTSAAIRTVRNLAEQYAGTEGTVLITGESGTGKELVAQGDPRRRHAPRRARSSRSTAPPSPRRCSSASCSATRRARSPARAADGKPGLFEAAHTGTIFLDEVGDVAARRCRPELLRVLQEREVLRLGGNDPTPIDVRVVAATNRDLQARGRRGSVPRGSLLPAQHPPHLRAAAPGQARRRRAARRGTPARRARPARRAGRAPAGARACSSPGCSLTPGRGTSASSRTCSSASRCSTRIAPRRRIGSGRTSSAPCCPSCSRSRRSGRPATSGARAAPRRPR